MARALAGDLAGAADDFEFYVRWATGNPALAGKVARRLAWIAQLRAGVNPIDAADIAELLER